MIITLACRCHFLRICSFLRSCHFLHFRNAESVNFSVTKTVNSLIVRQKTPDIPILKIHGKYHEKTRNSFTLEKFFGVIPSDLSNKSTVSISNATCDGLNEHKAVASDGGLWTC